MAITGQDGPAATGKLAEAIAQTEGELVSIEEMLGVELPDGDGKEAQYGDVPRRLDTLIDQVNNLTGRLSGVRGVVVRLKEAIG